MFKFLNRVLAAAVAVGCCLTSASWAQSPASTRALGIDDIVALEAFGRGGFSPDGRWAIYEKRGAYDTIPRFEFAQRSTWSIMDLWLIDLEQQGAAPERLLPVEGPGLLRVAWSPTGKRLLIYRLQGSRFEIGIVTLADRSVRWTGLVPEIPGIGASAQWVSDDAVIVMTRPDGSLPGLLRYHSEAHSRMTVAWDRTEQGREPSRTVIETRGGVATAETPEPPRGLVLVDAPSGNTRTLARGSITDFEVSPDHSRVAIVAGAEAIPMTPGPILQAENARRQRLSILRLADGAIDRPMEWGDVGPHLLRWSPDSASLLVWAREDGAEWTDGDLTRVSAREAVRLERGDLTPGTSTEILRGVRADWLGDTPVLYARNADGSRFDWHGLSSAEAPRVLTGALTSVPALLSAVSPGAISLMAEGSLWTVDATALRRVSASGVVVREAVAGDAEAVTRLRIEAPRRGWTPVLGAEGESRIIDQGGQDRRLGPGRSASLRTLAVSPQAMLVLDRSGLVETLRLRTEDGDYPLDAANARFAEVELPAPVAVPHLDASGNPTRSFLFLPKGGVSDTTPGLIVMVYPGGTETGAWSGPLTLTYGFRPEVLAGAGFSVLSPSMPMNVPAAERGDVYLQSVDLAVDAALAAVPELPSGRIGLLGHSFGGYAVLEIAARSHRYRSVVASSSFTDLFNVWGEFTPQGRILPEDGFAMRNQQGWVEAGQGMIPATPWGDPAAYIASSPLFAAERITAPVLLLTADRDYVPMSQSEEMFSALHRLGGRARLVTYWAEHHASWSPANIRDRYGQIIDWMTTTLAAPVELGATAPGGAPTREPIPRTPPPR